MLAKSTAELDRRYMLCVTLSSFAWPQWPHAGWLASRLKAGAAQAGHLCIPVCHRLSLVYCLSLAYRTIGNLPVQCIFCVSHGVIVATLTQKCTVLACHRQRSLPSRGHPLCSTVPRGCGVGTCPGLSLPGPSCQLPVMADHRLSVHHPPPQCPPGA